ncbi:MAG: sodium:solute symporter family protein [Planctomycetia bacterium]|nr:sodium:solute symporter family protein [Planctomycetia bacterium]
MLELPFILTILFFVMLLVIAAWGMGKTKNIDDFFLGGKTLGPWILAISYGTAYFSAVVFIGFAGRYGWQCGMKSLLVGVFNALVGGLLAWLVLGYRTRTMTQRLGAMTMPEFFSKRFDTNGLKIITACIAFLFLIPYSASVFAGLGYLFEKVFQIDMNVAITLITIITGIYVVCGGYKAAARIDFIQGLIMFVGAVLMTLFVIRYFGGSEALSETVARYTERLDGQTLLPAGQDAIRPIPNLVFWSVVFMTSLAPWGLPQMVHKYYAIKDPADIWRGSIIALVFAGVIGCAAYLTGAMTHLLPQEVLLEAVDKSGQALDMNKLVPLMLVLALPKWLLALILILVLSASMSTLSSLVLVSSSAVGIDLYKGYAARGRSDRHYLWAMRILSALFILISYLIALFNPAWIVPLMSLSWGAVAGSFLSPYLFGLYCRSTTKLGVYAGMWTGLLTANGIYWFLFFRYGSSTAGAYSPVAASVAIVLPFLVVPLVSCVTPPVRQETIARAFGDHDETTLES